MEQRISIITLGVADLNTSREFYERLGWRRSRDSSEGIVFFQAGEMALALYPREELAKDANVSPDGDGFRGVTLAYNARDRGEVDSVLEEAKASGANTLEPHRKHSGEATPVTSPTWMAFFGTWPGIRLVLSKTMGYSTSRVEE